eukprot:scaffold394_cov112-Isochrysis_galbana.AAC.2
MRMVRRVAWLHAYSSMLTCHPHTDSNIRSIINHQPSINHLINHPTFHPPTHTTHADSAHRPSPRPQPAPHTEPAECAPLAACRVPRTCSSCFIVSVLSGILLLLLLRTASLDFPTCQRLYCRFSTTFCHLSSVDTLLHCALPNTNTQTPHAPVRDESLEADGICGTQCAIGADEAKKVFCAAGEVTT